MLLHVLLHLILGGLPQLVQRGRHQLSLHVGVARLGDHLLWDLRNATSHRNTLAQEHNLISKYRLLVRPDLKEVLALCDHVCQTLSGSQILIQVLLVWAARGVLPLD